MQNKMPLGCWVLFVAWIPLLMLLQWLANLDSPTTGNPVPPIWFMLFSLLTLVLLFFWIRKRRSMRRLRKAQQSPIGDPCRFVSQCTSKSDVGTELEQHGHEAE